MDARLELLLKGFRENREWIEDRIKLDIEANRKGFAKLTVLDSQGKPVPDAQVELVQRTHDFRFGCNLFMLDELETPEKNEQYKTCFADMFNLATLPFYWSDLEPEQGKPRFSKDSPKRYRRPTPDLCLEYCREHGIEPKLHCLNYDQWTPNWVPVDADTVKVLLDKRIREIAQRYADQIPSMEAINESLCSEHYEFADRHSTLLFREPDLVEWSFACARRYLPANRLIINEATNHVWQKFKYNRSPYYMQVERALAKGATIDSIGMQYHLFYNSLATAKSKSKVYDPEVIFGTLDSMAEFGKPLQITEVTIPAFSGQEEDELSQAELLTTLYKIWFSHPAMEAIVYWNLVDGYAAFAEQGDMTCGENIYHGALLRFDMTPKPAYHALRKLIHEEWHTELSLRAQGKPLSFKGFYGQYDVRVTLGGQVTTHSIHIRKNHRNQFTVTV